MKNIFTEHPHSIGETYFKHLLFASQFGAKMMLGGLACFAHAIFPFLFQKTGSNILIGMTRHFIERMPKIEGKAADLCAVIENKKCNSQNK